jgi:hypothetical protein
MKQFCFDLKDKTKRKTKIASSLSQIQVRPISRGLWRVYTVFLEDLSY